MKIVFPKVKKKEVIKISVNNPKENLLNKVDRELSFIGISRKPIA